MMTITSCFLLLSLSVASSFVIPSYHCNHLQSTTPLIRTKSVSIVDRNVLLFSDASSSSPSSPPTPLCDLQTFLKLTNLVPTGGDAKASIQGGKCLLNGEVEVRRAKKLFPGDTVTFKETTLDVSDEVSTRGYVYKLKKKKVKPVAKVDTD
eukprot:CAMPEP_0119015846 /NCGR_PEP_ID=MMETSP1176-20130426/11685_1 /TAXON_ID=265551 /ORGANISM="Synedropsis recta cf, Strain CCMP1620" /LENGTH=150 /DNA_ID=CAMNT_0006969169 /DNA_START=16 /DNA_END=465 /DNA_ORIENTATION=-